MRHKLRILRRAQEDILEILRYVSRDAPDEAQAFTSRLLAAVESLEASPRRGRAPRNARLAALGFRVLLFKQYLVFYKVARTVVRVYRVLHGKRRYQDIL